MKIEDFVHYIGDNEDLKKKAHLGMIFSPGQKGDKWRAVFIDKKSNVICDDYFLESELKIWISPYHGKDLSCDGEEIKEYDTVMLMNDSEEYTARGFKKGMKGVVMEGANVYGNVEVDMCYDDSGRSDCIGFLGNDLRIIERHEQRSEP